MDGCIVQLQRSPSPGKEFREVVRNMLFENLGNPRLQTVLNFAPLERPDYEANLGFAEWESFTEVNPIVGIVQVRAKCL